MHGADADETGLLERTHPRAWRRSRLTQGEYCNEHGLKKIASLGYRLGKRRRQVGPVLHGPNGWWLELPAQVEAAWLNELLVSLP